MWRAGQNEREPEPADAPGCTILGHQFIQRGRQWVDRAADAMPEARRIRVRFDSREYFELMIKHPKMLPLVQTARNVQLALDDAVYEIYE